MLDKRILIRLAERIADFDRRCKEEQHTDIGEATDLLADAYKTLSGDDLDDVNPDPHLCD